MKNKIDLRDWEPVIGLEVHVQLNTKSKLFSSAPNRFGDEPNTNISVVCTGQPGALPILNKEAVRKAVQFGCAVNARVAHFSKFDRKSYFYPDSPRNYQITQYDQPIVIGGEVVAEVDGKEKLFRINRAHLEDDAGMLKHFSSFAGADYNRAGVPLLEIVSEPCIHSAEEAVAYVSAIKAIMEYIDASDCNMEEGSLRIDCNISVRRRGETALRPKIEIKNMNSFSNMFSAIESEIVRQATLYTTHPEKPFETVVEQCTYRWDPDRRETLLMRRKEDAEDYRYFPEPDLVPIVLQDSYITAIRDALPELPYQRKKRYIATLELSPYAANILTQSKALADFFEEGLTICNNPRNLCNWITVEFFGRFKESDKTLLTSGITSAHVATLVKLIDNQTITGKIAKAIADIMVTRPGVSPETIIAENPDFQPLHATDTIEPIIDEVLRNNPQVVADYQGGKVKAFGFLVGLVMQASRGKASPEVVNKLLKAKLG